MKYPVIGTFRDKYTGRIYKVDEVFLADDIDRVNDLQIRGLIGEEIPLTPPTPSGGQQEKGGESIDTAQDSTPTGAPEIEEVDPNAQLKDEALPAVNLADDPQETPEEAAPPQEDEVIESVTTASNRKNSTKNKPE